MSSDWEKGRSVCVCKRVKVENFRLNRKFWNLERVPDSLSSKDSSQGIRVVISGLLGKKNTIVKITKR